MKIMLREAADTRSSTFEAPLGVNTWYPSCMHSLIRSATPSEIDCLLAMEKTKAAMMVKAKVMTQAGGLFNHRRTRQNS